MKAEVEAKAESGKFEVRGIRVKVTASRLQPPTSTVFRSTLTSTSAIACVKDNARCRW